MANMVIPDEGKTLMLDLAIHDDGSLQEDMTLELYQNDYTPVNGSTAANFTASTFTGYAPVTVTRATMGTPAIVANVAYRERSAVPVFTCSAGGPQNAYGWFLRGAVSNTVYAAQRFDAVRVMSAGVSESIDPFRLGLQTLH